MVTFGPIHACPHCGTLVQVADRGYGRRPLEDARTGQRHHCDSELRANAAIRVVECDGCGRTVVIRDAERTDLNTGRRHECQQQPRPIPPPVRVGMAETGLRADVNYDRY